MRLTILRADNVVVVDGRGIEIDCSSIPDYIRAVTWDEDHGAIEMSPYNGEFVPNAEITSVADYQPLIDQWTAAAYLQDNPPAPPDPPVPPPLTKAELLAYSASRRFVLEVAGITSVIFGPLPSDRETRSIIAQTIQSIDLGIITAPINFKTGSGFVPLNRAQFIAISTELAAHVQSTFDKEGAAYASIVAGTTTTKAQVEAFYAA